MWYEGFRVPGGGSRLERGLVYARAAMLPFFWIGRSRRVSLALAGAGPLAAVLATAFYTTLPPILAHAGRSGNNGHGAHGHAGRSRARVHLPGREPRAAHDSDLRRCSGVRGKHEIFRDRVPAFGVARDAGVAVCSRRENPLREFARLRRYVAPAAGALATAAFVIRAAYRFDAGRVSGTPYILPAPEFFGGIRDLWQHNLQTHGAYVLGRRSPNGFWYYFPSRLPQRLPLQC